MYIIFVKERRFVNNILSRKWSWSHLQQSVHQLLTATFRKIFTHNFTKYYWSCHVYQMQYLNAELCTKCVPLSTNNMVNLSFISPCAFRLEMPWSWWEKSSNQSAFCEYNHNIWSSFLSCLLWYFDAEFDKSIISNLVYCAWSGLNYFFFLIKSLILSRIVMFQQLLVAVDSYTWWNSPLIASFNYKVITLVI